MQKNMINFKDRASLMFIYIKAIQKTKSLNCLKLIFWPLRTSNLETFFLSESVNTYSFCQRFIHNCDADLITTVRKLKLRWYGHMTRSTGLAKMFLQGKVQGGRRRGRQKKRWEDNIKYIRVDRIRVGWGPSKG